MSSVNWNRHFKGIRFRLTLVYATLFGLVLIVFAYVISKQYLDSGRADFDSNLINLAIDLSDHLTVDKAGAGMTIEVPRSEVEKVFPFILKQTHYAIRDLAGKVIMRAPDASSLRIPYDPELPLKPDYTHRLLTFESDGANYRAVNMRITNIQGKSAILQVATSFDSVIDREKNHLLVTVLMIPILILASSFFSFVITGNALAPIRQLSNTANSIAAQNLSLRLPLVDTGDEVEELTKTLNNLLARLETAFEAQENFVANASHQLNTPLAIIKGELDVLEAKERSPEEIQRFHRSLREELQRLIELVKNMLLVSRVSADVVPVTFHPVRLDDLLITTAARLQTKAREKRMIVRFNIDEALGPKELEVPAERQLLDALFENLLDNAIKYSPEGSTLEIAIKETHGNTEVCIQDEGPGLQGNTFNEIVGARFRRGNGHVPGSGIGLSIAAKIAQVHNASILHENIAPRGSLFRVRFSSKGP